jgi:FAD:protein FMN transferase
MKKTRDIMGMPITIETTDTTTDAVFEQAFLYFVYVDETFSTYKETSEITKINHHLIAKRHYSKDMKEIFTLAEKTKKETNGYFDIQRADGSYDPSGLVKGWSIYNAATILRKAGLKNFYVDAGGDVEVSGHYSAGTPWKIGIRNPFSTNAHDIIKVLSLSNCAVATSGTYIRGEHIYDPIHTHKTVTEIISMTVVGPNIYEADRFATAAFAMGKAGITFIEELQGFEGYMVDTQGIATMTTGFPRYIHSSG